ncbi:MULTISPECIES: hypothetical protein [Wolbachia]|uniref:hypothetical protein n=1 Tax=Wolbachia TaxID=953 RepID=UPI002021D510|nr:MULTISPECIES: hypothetical protein [unclassified Wolbachia]URG40407.1 hypothetical protein M1L25_000487 [Wolbachia endosymbiont of Ostrinia furnacalis]URG40583.1 hypothetical protein M1L26_000656 [Wolbachia endosymbiont of Ostrinia scapulalis]
MPTNDNNEEFKDAQEYIPNSQDIKLKKAILDILKSIARSSPNEKEEVFRALSGQVDHIYAQDFTINDEGLKRHTNKEEFKKYIEDSIKNKKIADLNEDVIKEALKNVNKSALERLKKAYNNDINKNDTENILDRVGKLESLYGDDLAKEIIHIIVFSPFYLIEAVVSIMAIGLRHLVKDVEKISKEGGREVVHHSKNILDTLKFWKDTRLEKFLLDTKGLGDEQYRSFAVTGYQVPEEQRKFAEVYRDNPLILDIIKEKMGEDNYLQLNIEGDEKIEITKSDCDKFKEKAASKAGADKQDFRALLGALSSIMKDRPLWKEILDTAKEKAAVTKPDTTLGNIKIDQSEDKSRGK